MDQQSRWRWFLWGSVRNDSHNKMGLGKRVTLRLPIIAISGGDINVRILGLYEHNAIQYAKNTYHGQHIFCHAWY